VDLKRGARVFFKSRVPLTAPINTSLGSIDVVGVSGCQECNLRYGNNGMDKVNLPVPGGDYPPKYDHSYVLWEKTINNSYRLHVRKNGRVWERTSRGEGTLFKYTGGMRTWGFFNAVP
jgi:hypothetical protein